MPINIQTGPLSALKVGHENVSSSYIGHQQVFPNSTTIQSAEFTDISTMGYNGGTRNFRITGDPGSTYSLSPYSSGSYTLSSSPYDHAITIGTNTGCGAGTATITQTLTPLGSTVLQGGGSSFSSSFSQSSSGAQNHTVTVSGSGTLTWDGASSGKVNIGGTDYWTPGAVFTYSFTVSYSSNLNFPNGNPNWTYIAIGGLGGIKDNGSSTSNAAESAMSGSGPGGITYTNGLWARNSASTIAGTYTGSVTLGGVTNFQSLYFRLFGGTPSNYTDSCASLQGFTSIQTSSIAA